MPRPILASTSPSSRLSRPPPPILATRRPSTHAYFGTAVVDPYEWLENPKDPETIGFTTEQTRRARGWLDGLPDRARIRDRIGQLLARSSADHRVLKASGSTLFVLVAEPPRQQAVLVVRPAPESTAKGDGPDARERVVLDPTKLDPSGKTTIDFFVPSPDGKLVAVSLSKNGSESGDVHVVDVATGQDTGEIVTRVNGGTAGGSVAWSGDGAGFYYTRYPRLGERPEVDLDFYQQIWFHKLKTPEARDTYSLGKDLPRIAEGDLERSDDGRFVLATIANGDGGEYEHHVLRPGASSWTRLTRFEDEVVHATFAPDGRIFAVSRKGAPRGKVVAFTAPFDKAPETITEEGEGVVEEVVVTRGALYLVELVGGPSRIRRVPLGVKPEPLAREPSPPSRKGTSKAALATSSKPAPTTIAPGARGAASAELPLPPVSSVTSVARMGEDLLVRVESYLEPPAWHLYRASEHRLVKTTMAKAPPADMSDVEVVRATCPSPDGTRVPISILHRKGIKLERDNPAILTGYGGFGLSRKPRLRPWYRAWLEQGGVLAEANLRGGGEMGAAWHAAGKLTRKQNVFDDFAACARAMTDLGYTRPARLGIWGRSNGGLLMGAAIVQHPELYRAAVSGVGIYDMLRVELSPNGAFNVPEFGTVKDEAQLRAMLAYSPFHNVKDGVAYPAILFTTGDKDPRVDPFHSRKMTARLQAATSSDNPVLLVASADTGHGAGTPLAAEIEETTDLLVFFGHELTRP